MSNITESAIEETVLEWRKNMGYTAVFGSTIAPKNRLGSLWDSLLPKLMRGEVRVKEVSQEVLI